MRKHTILFWFLLCISIGSFAQNDGGVSIGKGDLPAHSKAILELVSSNKGLLITRMTTDQRNAMFYEPDNSAKGLMVFDNTLNAFYFWDGAAWKTVSNGNIKTISGAPTAPGTAGEMVFDIQNSSLYVNSGIGWAKAGGSTSTASVSLAPQLVGNWLYLGFQDGQVAKVDLSSLKTPLPAAKDVNGTRNTSLGVYSDNVQDAIWELADKIKNASSGLTVVAHDPSLTGSGTTAIPLGVAAGGITNGHLASNAVTEEKIVNNAITSDKIANNTVTIAKIKGEGADRVLATNAAGTPEWISKSSLVGGNDAIVTNGTLEGKGTESSPLRISIQYAYPGAVLQWKSNTTIGWLPDLIRPFNLAAGSGTLNLGDGNINQVLASNGSGGFRWIDNIGGTIADGSITTTKIADGSITTAKIADGSITTAKMANDAITTAKVANEAITTEKIANGTIQGADLSSMGARTGDVLQWNGMMWAPAKVAISSIEAQGIRDATTFLRGDGTWGTPPTGGSGPGSAAVTNLSITNSASGMTINSSTGTSTASIPFASNTSSGLMTSADKMKLDGISGTGTGTGTGTVTLTGDVTGSGTGSIATTIAPITSAKIADATIQAADLSAMGATVSGQVLQWNGTTWGASSNNLVIGTGANAVTITAPTAGSGAYNLTLPQDDGSDGYVLKTNGSGVLKWDVDATTGGAGGGISSIGLALPLLYNDFTPLTAPGSFTGTLKSQTANTVLAGPTSGASTAPSFRTLAPADIPTLNQNTTGTAANISGGSAGQLLYQSAADVTAKLPAGTNGQVLTLASGVPTWADPTGGAGGGIATADNGLTAANNKVALGGTLTAATTINQNNNNLTFTTGTGKTIVNGNFQTAGAVYGKVRTYSGGNNVDWQPDDYVVVLTNNGISGKFALPDPTANAGRILCVRNNTGGEVAPTGADGTAFPSNQSDMLGGSGYMFISDGTNWQTMTGLSL